MIQHCISKRLHISIYNFNLQLTMQVETRGLFAIDITIWDHYVYTVFVVFCQFMPILSDFWYMLLTFSI